MKINITFCFIFWIILYKNTIRDGSSTALHAAYTFDTVNTFTMAYTVDMVYTVRVAELGSLSSGAKMAMKSVYLQFLRQMRRFCA